MVRMELQQFNTSKRCEYPLSHTDSRLRCRNRHQKYPEYHVVVSEIASTSRDKKEAFAFTAQVANWMDQCPWIFEYAFFGCMAKVADDFVSPEAQLMNSDGTLRLLMVKLMNEQPMSEL